MSHPAVGPAPHLLLDDEAIRRTLTRIAHEIIERNDDLETVALVGIQTRGVPLAQRLRQLVEERAGVDVPLGRLDVTFHRDDVHVRRGRAPKRAQPLVRDTKLDFELEGRTVVLVDDVLYTGRTIRAAIDALFEYGRPDRVQLAVLADRGHRELPIRPDYVGKNLPTGKRRADPGRAGRGRRGRPRPADPERGGPMTDLRLVGGQLLPPPRPRAPPPALRLGPQARRRRADPLDRTLVRALAGARDQEAADPARPCRPERLLRVVDADVVVVRARGQAALGRHDDPARHRARRSRRANR